MEKQLFLSHTSQMCLIPPKIHPWSLLHVSEASFNLVSLLERCISTFIRTAAWASLDLTALLHYRSILYSQVMLNYINMSFFLYFKSTSFREGKKITKYVCKQTCFYSTHGFFIYFFLVFFLFSTPYKCINFLKSSHIYLRSKITHN